MHNFLEPCKQLARFEADLFAKTGSCIDSSEASIIWSGGSTDGQADIVIHA